MFFECVDMIMLANSEVKLSDYEQLVLKSIAPLIDLDAIVDRLQAFDCQGCMPFTKEQVKFAFLKWLEKHLDEIESEPQWYVDRNPKHFDKQMPFPDEYDDCYCDPAYIVEQMIGDGEADRQIALAEELREEIYMGW